MLVYLLIILGLFVIITSIITFSKDKMSWNNGRCPCCNTRWRFKTTMYGSMRLYKCPRCGKEICITYNVDSDYYRNIKDYEG